MKRLFCVLLALLLLAGCAGSAVEINVIDAITKLHDGLVFDDIMSDMDTAAITRVFALTESGVVSAAGYISTGATAEEIFVIEAVEGKTQAVLDAIDDHLDYMISGYSSYGPEEVPKLQAAVVETHGNYIFFCVCKDTAQAKTLISQIVGN